MLFIKQKEKPKNFILNKPYWIIMKRANSLNPYFILGVRNLQLMDVKKNKSNRLIFLL